MEIEIDGVKYEFKDKFTVLDRLNSLKTPELQEGFRIQIRTLEAQSTQPKLSSKDILLMDYGHFQKLLTEVNKKYGIPSAFAFLGEK